MVPHLHSVETENLEVSLDGEFNLSRCVTQTGTVTTTKSNASCRPWVSVRTTAPSGKAIKHPTVPCLSTVFPVARTLPPRPQDIQGTGNARQVRRRHGVLQRPVHRGGAGNWTREGDGRATRPELASVALRDFSELRFPDG